MSNKAPLDLSKLSKRDFPLINDLSHEQEDMVNKLFKKQRVVVNAVAASGKTTVATQAMKALMDKGYIDQVYYVVFPTQEDVLGYLPGDLKEKLKEYAVPFIQALLDAGVPQYELDPDALYDIFAPGNYKVVADTHQRGRTTSSVGVLIDEAQNGTVKQLQKVTTRLSDSCYMVMAGHTEQTDIPLEASGFPAYIHHYKRGLETGAYKEIAFANLTHNFRGGFSAYSDQIGKTVGLHNSPKVVELKEENVG